MTCILFVIVGFHGNKLGSMFNNPKFIEYAWLVPFGVFLSGSYSALQYWATRERQFKAIAKTRVTQAIFGASTTLSLGAIGLSPLGLILGTILGNGAGSVNLARSALRNSLLPERLSIKRLVMVAMKNRNFASKSATEAILNVMGIQLSILIIAANSGPDGGHLFLAMQLMAVPLTLLGNSIAQVYLSRAPLEFRRGNLFEFTRKIMYRLAVAGALPLIAIGGIAPLFIPIVFGQEWQKSGEMMTLITPWMIVQFIASPISMVMYVTGKESQMLLLTSMGLLLRVGLVWLASTSGMSLVDAFALSSFLFYAICIVVFFNASQAKGVKVG
jgi:O-antigen/teichoic acid export membrane protein